MGVTALAEECVPVGSLVARLRPHTQDYETYAGVVLGNEYRLPEQFALEDVILDVGANIGLFALACLARGAGHVACFEPEAENYALLKENLEPVGHRASLYAWPVWRSDRQELVRLRQFPRRASAMHQILPGTRDGKGLIALGLDEVLQNWGGEVRLLKLDCEGSEFPILYTAKELRRCQEIVCEIHLRFTEAYADFDCTAAWLKRHLESQGFTVEVAAHPTADARFNQHLFARRV